MGPIRFNDLLRVEHAAADAAPKVRLTSQAANFTIPNTLLTAFGLAGGNRFRVQFGESDDGQKAVRLTTDPQGQWPAKSRKRVTILTVPEIRPTEDVAEQAVEYQGGERELILILPEPWTIARKHLLRSNAVGESSAPPKSRGARRSVGAAPAA